MKCRACKYIKFVSNLMLLQREALSLERQELYSKGLFDTIVSELSPVIKLLQEAEPIWSKTKGECNDNCHKNT